MFSRDILTVKEAQLNALVAESGGAVSLICLLYTSPSPRDA